MALVTLLQTFAEWYQTSSTVLVVTVHSPAGVTSWSCCRVGITTLWLMEAMVSVLSCRVQSNSVTFSKNYLEAYKKYEIYLLFPSRIDNGFHSRGKNGAHRTAQYREHIGTCGCGPRDVTSASRFG